MKTIAEVLRDARRYEQRRQREQRAAEREWRKWKTVRRRSQWSEAERKASR
jgi:hypothetical protein